MGMPLLEDPSIANLLIFILGISEASRVKWPQPVFVGIRDGSDTPQLGGRAPRASLDANENTARAELGRCLS